ncbi:uncharacterized protein N7529_006149 [Penicillium soppii]|uniref:uncharacterized protein n=1 Tax=Penicillium soppii TaxID=69789 RepID=UPI002548DCBB|nr:uncharacterized protein N7529_006149 [Penicillium soppii]KAJ5864233.1 hypothetical protein N7529_006149 [Penicillium soppii]
MRQSPPIHWVVQACLIWLTLLSASVAASLPNYSNDLSSATADGSTDIATIQARGTKPFMLRMLPLGASITQGYKSKDGNGYRKWLRQQLRYAGWEVDMIGSKKTGTMHNNNHEGHIGFRIEQIAEVVKKTLPQKPNLILINAGTNDGIQDYKVDSAGERMDSLLTELYAAIPGTTIILSTLIPNGKKPNLVADISEQYRDLAAKRRAQNDSLVLAEMSYFIKSDQLVDKIHPTAAGYEEMASVWWAAIQVAESEGFLKAPVSTSMNMSTISKAREKALDDSTNDPDLPAYTAPAQPTSTGLSPRNQLHRLFLAMQVLLLSYFFGTMA